MPAPSTIITTATAQTIAAEPGPSGSKIPVSALVVNGNVVTEANPLPATGEFSIATADLSAITGSIDAATAAIEDLSPLAVDPVNVALDGDLYDNLTAEPYDADIEDLTDFADAVDQHVGRITTLEYTVDTPTTGLADRVAELLTAVDALNDLVSDHATAIADLEAYNVSNP